MTPGLLSSQSAPCPLFPQSYTPTVFERLTVNLQMKGKPVDLQIWDTAGGCASLGEEQGGRRGPRYPAAKPYSLSLNRGGQQVSKGQVRARIRAPRNLNPPCFWPCVCCLPHPRAVHCVLETRGTPGLFPQG